MDFTILMAVYSGDEEPFVRQAYDSATKEQILPPTHAVIVRDGPVSAEIEAWLSEIDADPTVTVVRVEKNAGLASALNAGLQIAPTEVVARVDSDDICLPERFSLQIPLIEAGLDLVGGAVCEFTEDHHIREAIRFVETTQEAIERQARLETPFHHPSVVFRKQAVLAAGAYPEGFPMEDYLLWVRMLMNGAKVANVPQVVVCYRVGAGAYARRGGPRLARSEKALQKDFLSVGFITKRQYVRNRILRGPLYRFLPPGVRRVAYRLWRRARRPEVTHVD